MKNITLQKIKDLFSKYSRAELILLAAILLFVLLARLTFLHEPFERDEATYGYLGQLILDGAVPYKTALEIKPPGIMYLYAAMIWLFGIETTEGIRIATAFYVWGTILSVFWLGRYLYGSRTGLIAAFFYALYSSAPMLQGSSSNSENFMVLPIMLSACFIIRWLDSERRNLLVYAGIAAAASQLIKTVALPHVMLLFSAIVLVSIMRCRERGFRYVLLNVSWFLLPFVVMYGTLIIYLYANDALHDAIYWNFTFLKGYGGTTFAVALWRMQLTYSRLATEHVALLILGIPTFFWLLRKRDMKCLLVALMLPAAVIGLSLPKKFYPHYFIQMIPPLALLAGIGAGKLLECKEAVLKYLGASVVAITMIYSAYVDYEYYFVYSPEAVCINKYLDHGIDFVAAVKVANYLKINTKPGDYIYQWGWEPEIYFISGRRAPTPHYCDIGISWAENPVLALLGLRNDLLRKKPRYIVVQYRAMDNNGTPVILDILKNNYSLDSTMGNFTIYKLREAQ